VVYVVVLSVSRLCATIGAAVGWRKSCSLKKTASMAAFSAAGLFTTAAFLVLVAWSVLFAVVATLWAT
jgi:hypothetical protein